MNVWLVLAAIAFLTVFYVMIPVGLGARAYFRRLTLAACPVAGLTASVRIQRAGVAEALGCRSLRRVSDCSLWPQHQGCGQACLHGLEERPREARLPAS